MNKFFLLYLTSALATFSAEKANIQFISLSPQIFPATAEDFTGLDWTLALSSVGNPNSINHELMLAATAHGYSHDGTFVLQDPFSFEPFVLDFVLDVPPITDANANGLDDFFDPSVSVEGVRTQGRHPNANGGGEDFFATWSRGAGESSGTVRLQFPFFDLTFDHNFQLAHYRGEFSFDRTATNLSGNVAITNVIDGDRMLGPLAVQVLNTNTLAYTASSWSNGDGANYMISTNFHLRRSGTNFVSYWVLEDGYAQTGDLDYVDWLLVVSSGDANNNGRLDLTEGTTTPTERPRLEIVRLPAGEIQVTVLGAAGQTYFLESANAAEGAVWQTAETVTLSGAFRAITVPGSGARRFYRVRQQ